MEHAQWLKVGSIAAKLSSPHQYFLAWSPLQSAIVYATSHQLPSSTLLITPPVLVLLRIWVLWERKRQLMVSPTTTLFPAGRSNSMEYWTGAAFLVAQIGGFTVSSIVVARMNSASVSDGLSAFHSKQTTYSICSLQSRFSWMSYHPERWLQYR